MHKAKNLLSVSILPEMARFTVEFIKYLQSQRLGQRIVLIWDGASYHRSDEVKKFLAAANLSHEQDQWQITCIRFAPNAPEQNPVEDVWLQAKNFVRKYWHLDKSFNVVKWLFRGCLKSRVCCKKALSV